MDRFPSTLTREESDFMVERIGVRFAETGFYLWAVEVPGFGAVHRFRRVARPVLRRRVLYRLARPEGGVTPDDRPPGDRG